MFDSSSSLRHLLQLKAGKPHLLLLKASLGLYVVSLFLDGFYISGPNPEAWAPGFALLLVGWLALFDGVVAWLANPVLFASWLLFQQGKHTAALVSAMASLLLAVSFLAHKEIMVSEAPTYETVIGYGLGYGMWLAASAASIAASALGWYESSNRQMIRLSHDAGGSVS